MRKRILGALMAPVLAFGMAACSVEQTEEGEAPEIEGGSLPEYDVQPADVDVGVDTARIPVPDIDVNDTTRRDTVPRR